MSTTAEWLASLGMSEYAERFAENRVDISVLRDLTDQDLKDLGVVLGDRRKMLRAIGELAGVVPAAPGPGTATEPRPQDTAERRQLTVMFADLVDSTALSACLDPEDMREIIGAYQRCCAEQIAKSGGFVAKYMGDGVLAYFGYPQAQEDDAERAVRAALAVVDAAPRLRAGRDAALRVRAGIATGLAVVGDLIGEGVAQEHGIVGETPNLAARLQALAEPGQVVISQVTRRLTGGQFEYRALGKVPLKGLAEPVEAWQVRGVSDVESRFEAQHETALTPLVGREEELELLLRRWRQAADGEGRVVLLSGEPGIGKSRLLAELQQRLHPEPHTRLRYFCSPRHTDSAFYPTVTQLERGAGFEPDDPPDTKLDKLASLLRSPSGQNSDIQLLAELLSIPTGERYAPMTWSPQRKKEKTLDALVRQLDGLSRRQSVFMVYEDVHWIDPSSRELLDLIIERVARLPVLLVITFRPEFQPPWVGRAHVTSVNLSRLGRREGGAFVSLVAGNRALSGEIVEEILERTDGVPLFVEELTKAVLEAASQGESLAGAMSKTSYASLAVPATLYASLMARIDRLGADAKEIAQIGSVLGREFSYEALASIAQKTDRDLQVALARLGDAALVFCRGSPPQATYMYKHALVRDAAYGSLLRNQRRQLHGRVVAALEKSAATEPSLLAQHCAEAGVREKAVEYWLKAGQKALTRSAMAEAVALLRKGLALLSDMPNDEHRQRDELEFQIALGQAFQAIKGPAAPETGEAYTRARTLCEQLNKPAQLAPVLFGMWIHHLMRGELEASRQDAVMWQRLAEDHQDVRLRVMGYRIHGQSEFLLGDLTSARTNLEQGLALFEPVDRPYYATLTPQDGRVLMLCFLSNALAAMGYADKSLVSAEEAVADARRLGHSYTLAIALAFALPQHYIGGWAAKSPTEALRRSEELEILSTQHGLSSFRGYAMVWRGSSVAALGRPQQGIEVITQGIATTRASGVNSFIPHSITELADAHGMAGQPAIGLECLDEAISIIEATGERWYEAEVHRLRGDLLKATGDRTAAEASFRHAIAVASKQQAKLFQLGASTSLARLWCDQGKHAEAHDLLAPIYGWFTEGFGSPILEAAKAVLEDLAQRGHV
jgi:class 3 adenylate cyclase/predicted ATPase